MKIVYLPLDERPCNLNYPMQLAAMTDLELTVPRKELLGKKKIPANTNQIYDWLNNEIKDANYLIVSLDMFLYGGIVPSRLHQSTPDEVVNRLNQLAEMKENNKDIRILAFNLIMRTPSYNSSDEEPDYYAVYGEKLYRHGHLLDKIDRSKQTVEEEIAFKEIVSEIPAEILNDYTNRRKTNAFANKYALELVKQGIVDFLVIPLDDNAEYGFSSKEQRSLIQRVLELGLNDKVAIYPGADEVGCTLFAKAFCEVKKFRPSFFVRYSSTKGPFIIPKLEDRSLGESIKSQISTAGGKIVDNNLESDAVLMVHSPAVSKDDIAEPVHTLQERHPSYFSEMNYQEFVNAIRLYVEKGKVLGIADVALCNGSDVVLMNLLKDHNLIDKVNAYAGWNTSGNTLGTVIAHTTIESFNRKNTQEQYQHKSREFYYARLIEDWGYQAIVKHVMIRDFLAQYEATYFDISKNLEIIEGIINAQLQSFIDQNLLIKDKITLDNVNSPWKRMFEVGLEVTYRKGCCL
ncbi:hypothetical protein CWR48_00330 [Oceanobacillus arenosus]|uniref:DUF4127 domain-containing protein n=1 Tax=Oceanobacillus arenosus TaxID=1229153 RepID=A0A3D8Q176_9BACI|nr:DUF4127 family protein [Oceanobacillus arenosus]RDW22190.1 hypothetical protein CWR48_00330 [Oceanobacillus arenosus]